MGSEQIVITVINQRDKAALPAVHNYYTNNNDRPLALKSMKCKGSNSPRKWEGIQLKSFAEENSLVKPHFAFLLEFFLGTSARVFFLSTPHLITYPFYIPAGQGCQNKM